MKADLREIHGAPTRAAAEAAMDVFAAKYGAKYARAVACLTKDREALLSFYDMPAEHWDHLRTTDALDKSFSSERDCDGAGSPAARPFLRNGIVVVRGRPPRYSSIARATTWPRAG